MNCNYSIKSTMNKSEGLKAKDGEHLLMEEVEAIVEGVSQLCSDPD